MRYASVLAGALWALLVACGSAEVREWTDTSGKHTVRAELVGISDGSVALKKESGQTVQVPLESLTRKDLEFAFGHTKAAPQDVVKFLEPAVVTIETNHGQGSGFVVDERGMIVTNYHVIEEASQAVVVFKDRTELSVKGVIAWEPGRDIALLKVEASRSLPTLPLAEKLPGQLEAVIAVGAPRGLGFSATEGTVSATRTTRELLGIFANEPVLRRLGLDVQWVQTSAAISPGNSGGPLVNLHGQVVGMNTFSIIAGQNLNFAVSALEIRQSYQAASPDQCLALSGRPKREESSGSPPAREKSSLVRSSWTVRLPSGEEVSHHLFDIQCPRLSSNPDTTHMHLRTQNGFGLWVTHSRGVPEGPTVSRYPNERPCVYVDYQDGKRHGSLSTWTEAGEQVLFLSYKKGRRTGVGAFFQERIPRLILEYKADTLTNIHWLEDYHVAQSFDTEEKALEVAEVRPLLEAFHEREEGLEESEREFRKLVRDEDERLRKLRVSQLNPGKRDAIQRRVEGRAKANADRVRSIESPAAKRP